MQTASISSIKSIPPALIGAALDCLAQLPEGHRLFQTLLRSVTYKTNTVAASTLTRTITYIINDGLALSIPAPRNVTLT